MSNNRRPITTVGFAFWRIAAVAWCSVVIGLSVAKSLGLASAELRQLERLVGGDLALHGSLAAGMAFLISMAIPWNWLGRGFAGYFVNPVFANLALVCLLDELLQLYLPTRAFSWWDFLASLVGLVAGAVVAWVFRSGRVWGE